jgi:hypothetical protein
MLHTLQPPTAQPTPAPRTFCAGGVAVVSGTGAYDGNYIESTVIDDPNATSVSAIAAHLSNMTLQIINSLKHHLLLENIYIYIYIYIYLLYCSNCECHHSIVFNHFEISL